jgi:hypothetical protein
MRALKMRTKPPISLAVTETKISRSKIADKRSLVLPIKKTLI